MVAIEDDASRIARSEGLRRYLDAGMSFTQVNRTRARKLVQGLVKTGELERERAEEWADALVQRTRERSEALVRMVRNEVRSQLDDLSLTSIDHIAKQVADILASTPETVRKAATRRGPVTRRRAARKVTAKKTTARKAPAKKTAAAKRTPAKSVAAKKTVAKKTPAKRAPAARATARRS